MRLKSEKAKIILKELECPPILEWHMYHNEASNSGAECLASVDPSGSYSLEGLWLTGEPCSWLQFLCHTNLTSPLPRSVGANTQWNYDIRVPPHRSCPSPGETSWCVCGFNHICYTQRDSTLVCGSLSFSSEAASPTQITELQDKKGFSPPKYPTTSSF